MKVQPDNRSLKILLIDGDKDDYDLIRDLLSEVPTSRYELTWVDSFDTALKELDPCRHHVCLVDYRLGLIRALRNLFEKPVIRTSPCNYEFADSSHGVLGMINDLVYYSGRLPV